MSDSPGAWCDGLVETYFRRIVAKNVAPCADCGYLPLTTDLFPGAGCVIPKKEDLEPLAGFHGPYDQEVCFDCYGCFKRVQRPCNRAFLWFVDYAQRESSPVHRTERTHHE